MKGKFFPRCGGGNKKEKELKKAAYEKVEAVKMEIELEMLEEAGRLADQLEAEALAGEQEADRLEKEAEEDAHALNEEERKNREELAALRQELFDKQKEREELSVQLEALTIQSMNEKKEREEQQYDKMISLQNDVLELKKELEAKISQAVADAKEQLEQKLQDARQKLMIVQNQIHAEQAASIVAFKSMDEQKVELKKLQSAALGQRKSLDELEKLKKENMELRRKHEEEKRKEIRVEPRVQLPGFAVMGHDVDVWIDRTRRNVKTCFKSFCDHRQPVDELALPNPPDGVLCQYCGCGLGPHERGRCRICRSLDLTDATLLP